MGIGTVASSSVVLVATGSQATVPLIRAEFVLRAISAIGHPAATGREIAAAVGLEALLAADDANARIRLSELDALYEEGARRTGDPAFGLHASEHAHPTMLDLAGYALLNSPCLAQAFERLRPYLQMLHGPEELILRIDGGVARFSYRTTHPRVPASRHRTEAYLGIVLRIARVALGYHELPAAVAFAHRAPPDVSEHRRIFGAPVHFDCSVNEIVFDPALLERPLDGADPSLFSVLDRYLNDLSARAKEPRQPAIAGEVRRLLPELLRDGEHAMPRVAKLMHMSTRTLQRRLRAEGTSYHGIVEEARRELALRYLRESTLPIGQIADRLGYATVAAFYDAFHRWTSRTPRGYRRDAQSSAELTG